MFDVYCEGHGDRILLSANRIRGIHNTPQGIQVVFSCRCGHAGVWNTGQNLDNAA